MKVKVFTIFPEIFPGFLGYSLTGKALDEGKWSLETVNIRDYATDKHGSVDDTPCGGGAGMVMRPDILGSALRANYQGGRLIYMSPRGKPLTQSLVHELAAEDNLSVICGRFEGIDQRVLDAYNVEEISIGDYVLTGGEQAAQIMLDAVVRLLPGVLGNADSTVDESFENGLLEHPQYTRPIEWEADLFLTFFSAVIIKTSPNGANNRHLKSRNKNGRTSCRNILILKRFRYIN